jgi:hypothetical protein
MRRQIAGKVNMTEHKEITNKMAHLNPVTSGWWPLLTVGVNAIWEKSLQEGTCTGGHKV